MRAVRWWWFSGAIGIVLAETDWGERKAYIGVGRGFNEDADVQYIMEYGTKVHPQQLAEIVNELRKVPA